MGLMFVPEPAQAVAEIRRVLRPSGRVAAAVWAAPENNPWLTTLGMAAMMHGVVAGNPPIGPGTPFALCDPARLRALFETAGFTGVRVTAVDGVASYPDVEAYFETAGALAPPLAAALRTADPAAMQRVRATVVQALERFATADGIRMPSKAWIVTAVK
jgi:SAM-dependent methyltransferase